MPRVLPLPSGWTEGTGSSIDAGGDVLGRVWSSSQSSFALWQSDGTFTLVGAAGGSADARDLNGRRQVAGCGSATQGTTVTPWVWENGRFTGLEPSNWNEPSGCAKAINEAGVVAGVSTQASVFANRSLRNMVNGCVP